MLRTDGRSSRSSSNEERSFVLFVATTLVGLANAADIRISDSGGHHRYPRSSGWNSADDKNFCGDDEFYVNRCKRKWRWRELVLEEIDEI